MAAYLAHLVDGGLRNEEFGRPSGAWNFMVRLSQGCAALHPWAIFYGSLRERDAWMGESEVGWRGVVVSHPSIERIEGWGTGRLAWIRRATAGPSTRFARSG